MENMRSWLCARSYKHVVQKEMKKLSLPTMAGVKYKKEPKI